MVANSEHAVGLAFLPIVTTIGYYILPLDWQSNLFIQFTPQLSAYVALGLWSFHNNELISKLGLEPQKIMLGVKYGISTGILLGCVNTTVILYLAPLLGENIEFLRHTPHAQIPFWIMVPWFILGIACAVEVNFRGFLLGRLLTFCTQSFEKGFLPSHRTQKLWLLVPVLLSALTFSFDPFMVATFGSLHWIAVWDGLIWGWMWIRLTNLYAVTIAHAVEVLILYLTVRAALI